MPYKTRDTSQVPLLRSQLWTSSKHRTSTWIRRDPIRAHGIHLEFARPSLALISSGKHCPTISSKAAMLTSHPMFHVRDGTGRGVIKRLWVSSRSKDLLLIDLRGILPCRHGKVGGGFHRLSLKPPSCLISNVTSGRFSGVGGAYPLEDNANSIYRGGHALSVLPTLSPASGGYLQTATSKVTSNRLLDVYLSHHPSHH